MKNAKKLLFLCLFVGLFTSLNGQWNIETVSQYGEATKIAYDSQGYPHIVSHNNNSLYYSFFSENGWTTQQIGSSSYYSCMTLFGNPIDINIDNSDNIHIIYAYNVRPYDSLSSYVYYISKTNGVWSSPLALENSAFSIFDQASLTFRNVTIEFSQENNQAFAVYKSVNNLNLKIFNPNTSEILDEIIVDTFSGNQGLDTCMDVNENLHIVYIDNGLLKHAVFDGNVCSYSVIDGFIDEMIDGKCSIASDGNGNVGITYYDSQSQSLKYALITPN